MSSPKKREPKMRKETLKRREAILDAALVTFGSKGFNNGSLVEIAEQVDMTHAGVLHHFGSKDHLLLEVLTHRDEVDEGIHEGIHEGVDIPKGEAFFDRLVETAAVNQDRPGIVQSFTVLSSESVTEDHPARQYFKARYERLRADGIEALEFMCAERSITDESQIATAAAAVLAVMDGLQVQWLLDPEKVDLGQATDFAIRAIVAAITK